jgi:hypothetical protein
MGRGIATGHQKADRLQRLQAALNFVNDPLVVHPGKSLLQLAGLDASKSFQKTLL